MADVLQGADALGALNGGNDNGGSWTSFKSGTTFHVKVVDPSAVMRFFSYGMYKPRVNSFVAENPSKKSRAGNPVEDLTPWDKAWKYHADLSEQFGDDHSQEAYKYKPKERFAMAFYDLDSGETIIIDLSKKQGQAVHGVIQENKDKLDRMTFKLSKRGADTATVVSLTPHINVANVKKMKEAGIEVDEDLTPEQQENFDNAPEEFDAKLFEGLLFEIDEDEQIRLLAQTGFDVSLIGLEVPPEKEEDESKDEGEPVDISDDDLPF